jgi:hypothetical protein
MRKPRTRPRTKGPKGLRPRTPRLSEAQKRRQKVARARIDAEAVFPVVKEKIEEIRLRFSDDVASGRFGYLKPLKRIYRLVIKWNADEVLDARLKTVANLYEIVPRKDANRFSVLVKACTNRDRKTISRWSLLLKDALDQEISPQAFATFAKNRSAQKTKAKRKRLRPFGKGRREAPE